MIFRRACGSDYFLYYENWRAQSDDDAFAEGILSYNVGIAIHDIRFAFVVYKLAGARCEDLNLNSPVEKFSTD